MSEFIVFLDSEGDFFSSVIRSSEYGQILERSVIGSRDIRRIRQFPIERIIQSFDEILHYRNVKEILRLSVSHAVKFFRCLDFYLSVGNERRKRCDDILLERFFDVVIFGRNPITE